MMPSLKRCFALSAILLSSQLLSPAATWTSLANSAPSGAGTMILLTDGTVMIEHSDHTHWMRLTPDAQGSYVNGTWTQNAINPMNTGRLYFASNVLPDGRVWVFGGESLGSRERPQRNRHR